MGRRLKRCLRKCRRDGRNSFGRLHWNGEESIVGEDRRIRGGAVVGKEEIEVSGREGGKKRRVVDWHFEDRLKYMMAV